MQTPHPSRGPGGGPRPPLPGTATATVGGMRADAAVQRQWEREWALDLSPPGARAVARGDLHSEGPLKIQILGSCGYFEGGGGTGLGPLGEGVGGGAGMREKGRGLRGGPSSG